MLITLNKQIIRTLKKLKILPYANFLVNYRYNSVNYKVPVLQNVGYGIMRSDFANSWLISLFKKIPGIDKDVTIIDIGVNLGQTLLGIKTISNGRIKYIGFEPNPMCVYYAEKLIDYNNFKDCRIIPAALSGKNGLISFIASSDTDDAASIVQELRPGKFQKKEQYVCTLKFDDITFSNDIENVIIKIDVEGAELDVIQGMQHFIKIKRPPIICEVLHAHSVEQLEYCRRRNEDLMNILKTIDYKVFRIIKHDVEPRVTGFEEIAEFDRLIYNQDSGKLCDYLFLSKKSSLPTV